MIYYNTLGLLLFAASLLFFASYTATKNPWTILAAAGRGEHMGQTLSCGGDATCRVIGQAPDLRVSAQLLSQPMPTLLLPLARMSEALAREREGLR